MTPLDEAAQSEVITVCEQSHEAATITALADVTWAARNEAKR